MESSYFRAEDTNAIRRHVERLVKEGKLPQSALPVSTGAAVDAHAPALYNVPTVVRQRPAAEHVYQHVKGVFPERRASGADKWLIGTEKVSLGRARWTVSDASIFSVADGKRLAQTPVRVPTAFEAARMGKINKAALDTPLVSGYRLLPQFTPGRALLWGTILAMWGTGAVVVTAARRLDITKMEEAKGKIEAALLPYVDALAGYFEPLQGSLKLEALRNTERSSEFTELANNIRRQLKP